MSYTIMRPSATMAPRMPATENERIKKLEDLARTMHGWSTENERGFLYREARRSSPHGAVVEIGSWKGKSTIFLGRGAKDGGGNKVYAIDPFTGSSEHQSPGKKVWTFDEFKKNIEAAELTDVVSPIVARSEDAATNWNRPISFLFIDGAHEPGAVEKDFALWSPHLIHGGTIAFHDTTPSLTGILRGIPLHGLPGPRRAIERHLIDSKDFEGVGLVDSIVYARKCTGENSFWWRFSHEWLRMKIRYKYSLYRFYQSATRLPQPIKTFLKRPFF